MATAFTDQEKEIIIAELKKAARELAVSMGMRKTTVDQLAARAGISKGAFYGFYDTKELLFLDMLKDWHGEVYGTVLLILCDKREPSEKERLVKALLYISKQFSAPGVAEFFRDDVPLIMRKVPKQVLAERYKPDEVQLMLTMSQAGYRMNQSPEMMAGFLRFLLVSYSQRQYIGKCYDDVLEMVIRGACDQSL